MKRYSIIPALAIICLLMVGCGKKSLSLDYLAVKTSENANWSFVGPDGKLLYEDEFENRPSSVINGYFTVEENNGISVYKAEKKKPELVPGLEDLVAAGIMNDGLIPVTRKNERIKLVDASGKEKLTLMPVDGNEIICVENVLWDGLLKFMTSEEKWGVISKSGKVTISPRYDGLSSMGEGIFYAWKRATEDGEENKYLLDKNGKEIVKFKEPLTYIFGFVDGKALVKTGDKGTPGYINKKGKFTKLPEKIYAFGEFFNGKEFTFMTEDRKYGLMNLEGEVLIRPKYDYLDAYTKGKFYVKDGEEKWSILNKSGEKEKSYTDFRVFAPLSRYCPNTKFEVVAEEEKHDWDFYTFDGKPVTKESFYAVGDVINLGTIETDYFNAQEVGGKMAALVSDNGIKEIALGSEINKVLPEDAEAVDYNEKYSIPFTDGITGGHNWSMNVIVNADGPIASPEYTTKTETYWLETYTREVVSGYHFNQAKIYSFVINAVSNKDFVDEAAKAVVADLKKRGFKEQKHDDDLIARLTKGNTLVSVYKEDDNDKELYLVVGHEMVDADSEPESDSSEEDNAVNSESVE